MANKQARDTDNTLSIAVLAVRFHSFVFLNIFEVCASRETELSMGR